MPNMSHCIAHLKKVDVERHFLNETRWLLEFHLVIKVMNRKL